MPIYEYRCNNCNKKSSFLVGVLSENTPQIICPKCKSENFSRVISRVSFVRSEEEMLESLADPSKIGDMNDPQALKQWAKKLGRNFGDELGEGFDEELEKMEEEESKGNNERGDEEI